MSVETNTTAPSRRRLSRRVLGSVLGLAVVVGTGAAANASAHGDGFLKQGATPTSMSTHSSNSYNGNGYGYNSSSSSSSAPSWHNTGWTWTGQGTNHWGFQSIGDPKDTSFNQALGINNQGVITGYYGSGKDATHPNQGWWSKSPYSSYHDVNFPGSSQTQVVGINDDGTAVGFYVENDGSNHGFVRWQGQYISVDWPHTTSSPSFNQLLGISKNGIAAGYWNDAKGNSHGYLFNTRTHKFTPIRLPWGATSIVVTGVNDDGTVVGFAVIHKITVAFVVTRRTAIVIKLGNGKNTQALGVNRKGVVVGSFEDKKGRTHGFVWSKGSLRIVDAPWHSKSTVVNGLNDSGWIVGFFEDSSGNTKGFVAKQ